MSPENVGYDQIRSTCSQYESCSNECLFYKDEALLGKPNCKLYPDSSSESDEFINVDEGIALDSDIIFINPNKD